jgi:DNA-binding Lrp family transcriptional regulator
MAKTFSYTAQSSKSALKAAGGIDLDEADRAIINALQGDFPVCEHPYAQVASDLGLEERQVIGRIEKLLADGVLSRFGPLYHAEKMGGELTLAAIAVPEDRFDDVTDLVNAHEEVAHNYERDDDLNMWFVVATDQPGRIAEIISDIENETGLAVHNMPKLEEFFVGLRFEV